MALGCTVDNPRVVNVSTSALQCCESRVLLLHGPVWDAGEEGAGELDELEDEENDPKHGVNLQAGIQQGPDTLMQRSDELL
jgi:hypothetical protein